MVEQQQVSQVLGEGEAEAEGHNALRRATGDVQPCPQKDGKEDSSVTVPSTAPGGWPLESYRRRREITDGKERATRTNAEASSKATN